MPLLSPPYSPRAAMETAGDEEKARTALALAMAGMPVERTMLRAIVDGWVRRRVEW